ncbi:MAG TPA: SCP2 sterol-binding domain-containing protein [Smithella sp.]|nr:SCP2 sterol-binding domain-containing protein [Smithella sp.]MDM7987684.1 SCP2 sterol-binding domain-containing protein [Smithella sp.]HNY49033.1 SCP2 sterol-binding domain-containing protein [Smithella sp.]HOG90000.1 SCP2 sterol-binding domain-containing protein [Smithella sp.]HOU50544.1 SCP2 sterol-binding domain-containing protein [Smithella sp.]
MAVFKDTEYLYEVLGGFWKSLYEKQEFNSAVKEADIQIKFEITEPSAVIWVGPDGVEFGEQALRADVTMQLAGDVCHAFWKKDLNLPVALAMRKIKSKGNIAKVMKLLPIVKPAYELYPVYMKQHGL